MELITQKYKTKFDEVYELVVGSVGSGRLKKVYEGINIINSEGYEIAFLSKYVAHYYGQAEALKLLTTYSTFVQRNLPVPFEVGEGAKAGS